MRWITLEGGAEVDIENRQGRTATSEIRFVGEQYRFEDIPMVIYGDEEGGGANADRK